MINKTLYAVVLVKDDNKSLCATYNPTHDVWQPAIFEDEERACKFYEDIKSVKGYEHLVYEVVKVRVVG